jgi:hypothetical protein
MRLTYGMPSSAATCQTGVTSEMTATTAAIIYYTIQLSAATMSKLPVRYRPGISIDYAMGFLPDSKS